MLYIEYYIFRILDIIYIYLICDHKHLQKYIKYDIQFIENQMKKGRIFIMKNLVKTLKNNEKAITLISLVVTIIVLLILARNKYFDVKSEIIVF